MLVCGLVWFLDQGSFHYTDGVCDSDTLYLTLGGVNLRIWIFCGSILMSNTLENLLGYCNRLTVLSKLTEAWYSF